MPSSYHIPTILQVLPRLGGGGVERGTVDIANAIVQKGWKSLVLSEGGPMVAALEAGGSTHLTGPYATKNPWKLLLNAFRMIRILKDCQVDLVHVRSRAPAWSSLIATHYYGCPLVSTFHGYYRHHNRFKRWYNSSMLRGDRIICGSEFILNHVHTIYGIPKTSLDWIPRGVDLSHFDPSSFSADAIALHKEQQHIPPDAFVFLLPGRMTYWKGQLIAIDAFETLAHPKAVLLLVGPYDPQSQYVQRILQRIQTSPLRHKIYLIPHQLELRPWYATADIVLSTSTEPETFGRVAVEAQAMERPVIATAIGASYETVIPYQTGWLIPPGQSAMLATALAEAASLLPSQRRAMGKAARTHVVQHFSLEKMCEKTLQLYQSLL